MKKMFAQLYQLMTAQERRRLFLLMGIMIAATFAELFGVWSVFGLLSILSEPELIAGSETLFGIKERLGLETDLQFQQIAAIAVFVTLVLGIGFRALGQYSIIRYSAMRSHSISSRLLRKYLDRSYHWYLSRNSAEISRNVIGEVEIVVNAGIRPILELSSNILIASAMLAFLLVVDPFVTLLAFVLIGGSYAGIFLAVRRKLVRIGERVLEHNKVRFTAVNEAMGGFKQVKISGLEDNFGSRFENSSFDRARLVSTQQLVSLMPRLALEGITFGIMLLVVFVLLVRADGNLTQTLPTLGVFAFAVMRLLPAVQQIYVSLTSLKYATATVNHIHSDYMEALAKEFEPEHSRNSDVFALTKELRLNDVSFHYANSEKTALDGVSMEIPARSTIGIVGGSGAGKTTLVDLVLGLFQPQAGRMSVDGLLIDQSNVQDWQKSIGYVPQDIFLSDQTVAENIAFGIDADKIDRDAVERAAKLAHLHEFVRNELPNGYDTIVGERGVRMSGGQRQRIGIARAVYHQPSLLVMDEATSALDNITERYVMQAINSIRKEKTVILIAHRLTTVKNCDAIFLMEEGQVVAKGTYDELIESSDTFRDMALGA